MKKSFLITLFSAAVLVSACGGGGDDSPPAATEQVPASASASVAGWFSYLKLLVVAAADGLESVDVSAVTAPTDDTAEPSVVD